MAQLQPFTSIPSLKPTYHTSNEPKLTINKQLFLRRLKPHSNTISTFLTFIELYIFILFVDLVFIRNPFRWPKKMEGVFDVVSDHFQFLPITSDRVLLP
jgi:hypothetical protein